MDRLENIASIDHNSLTLLPAKGKHRISQTARVVLTIGAIITGGVKHVA
jgi:hypothetical protein